MIEGRKAFAIFLVLDLLWIFGTRQKPAVSDEWVFSIVWLFLIANQYWYYCKITSIADRALILASILVFVGYALMPFDEMDAVRLHNAWAVTLIWLILQAGKWYVEMIETIK